MLGFSEQAKRVGSLLESRTLVFTSLLLHIFLVVFGSRRRYMTRNGIRFVVWLAYVAAEPIATFSLSRIAYMQHCEGVKNPIAGIQLQLFWVPFLLFHLGGADTITAYALEDNELWLRHLFTFVVQIGLALYVSLWSWNNSLLAFLAIPVFINGTIKYGERTFILWSSSAQCFKASSEHDPSPNFIKNAMRDMNRKVQSNLGSSQIYTADDKKIYTAFLLFKRFARLYAGLILKDEEASKTYQIFLETSPKDAFNLVAIELGIVFDMLYTKVAIAYTRLGIFFRCFSFVSCVSALVIFSIFIGNHPHSNSFIDVFITYSLLVEAIVAEAYTFIHHFLSDWTKLLWLSKSKSLPNPNDRSSDSSFTNQKRWSETVGQLNLISFCLKDLSKVRMVLYSCRRNINVDLQELIFKELLDKIRRHPLLENFELRKKVLTGRGDYVLERHELGTRFDWCITKVEFEYSLLAWHIATDLCYHYDLDKRGGGNNLDPKWKLSAFLSDYMLYLLVQRPSVMPKGVGDLRFKETCSATLSFFKQDWFEVSGDKNEILKSFFEKRLSSDNVSMDHTDDSLSVLKGGRILFNQLQSLESENGWSNQKKWEMITEMWVELLTFAANQSGWIEHIQQLKNGGELLTIVRLLMTHLGLSEQYRPYGRSIP